MSVLTRAYSLLEIKGVDDEKRELVGIASTATPDRMQDVVEPKGAEFKLPIPLLWQHNSREPIGHVTHAKITKDGIEVRAKIAKVDEPGTLKDRLDEAWQSIKSGLVRGLSIGFKEIESTVLRETGGIRFIRWLWLELSAVTIPANAEATITAIKSIDQPFLAASGHDGNTGDRPATPGATGSKSTPPPQRTMKMARTIAEQIGSFEATRQAKSARMAELMNGSAEKGETLDADQSEEYDGLSAELKQIDKHLERLADMEKLNKAAAKPVEPERVDGITVNHSIRIKAPVIEKGIRFARYIGALATCKGDRNDAAQFAKRWHDSTPEIADVLSVPADVIQRTAVAAGTTTDATWAGPLVVYQNLQDEFIEYLRPLTIIGRINGFRRVPFKVKVPRQTAGASVNWIGETKIKPLSSLAFDTITFEHFKIAGIIPLSEELVRFSNPSAEMLVRDDLARAITQLMDADFVDPTKALQAGVSPASITNGVSATVPTGTSADAFRADVKTMFTTMLTANLQISGGVWIMTQGQALSLSLMRNALDQDEFPGITMNGGTLLGFPVVASQNIPATGGSPTDGYPIIFAMPQEIMLADDGGVNIDVSREASLLMDTAPDSPVSASSVLVNLWQHNMIAVKAERFINWLKVRDTAVGYISNGKYA